MLITKIVLYIMRTYARACLVTIWLILFSTAVLLERERERARERERERVVSAI